MLGGGGGVWFCFFWLVFGGVVCGFGGVGLWCW